MSGQIKDRNICCVQTTCSGPKFAHPVPAHRPEGPRLRQACARQPASRVKTGRSTANFGKLQTVAPADWAKLPSDASKNGTRKFFTCQHAAIPLATAPKCGAYDNRQPILLRKPFLMGNSHKKRSDGHLLKANSQR
jgi:hypothetical protein